MNFRNTILLISAGMLTFTACKKRNDEFDQNKGNPEKALQEFINQESNDIDAYWLQKKDFNDQWTGEFNIKQKNILTDKITVNNTWEKKIFNKEESYKYVAEDFTTFAFNQTWDFKLQYAKDNSISYDIEYEVSQKLVVDIDLNGVNYINPNYGFTINTHSYVPKQYDNKSGEIIVVLYAKDENLGIHNYMQLPLTSSTGILNIAPEDLASFNQFNELEIHVFQREMMNTTLENDDSDIVTQFQFVSAQSFKYPFSIY